MRVEGWSGLGWGGGGDVVLCCVVLCWMRGWQESAERGVGDSGGKQKLAIDTSQDNST